MNQAIKMEEAANGMMEAAEKFEKSVNKLITMNGMIAENQQRAINGYSLAYGEVQFEELNKE